MKKVALRILLAAASMATACAESDRAAEIVARYNQAEASLQQAERDWKRVATLFEQQAAARAEYEAAETRRRVAEGAAAEAKAMLGYVELVAPFDGLITKKWVEAGDLASRPLSVPEIVRMLGQANWQSRAGGLTGNNRETLVETGGFSSAQDIGNLVGVFEGRPIHLREVAEIQDSAHSTRGNSAVRARRSKSTTHPSHSPMQNLR